jgi:hypothetical protein
MSSLLSGPRDRFATARATIDFLWCDTFPDARHLLYLLTDRLLIASVKSSKFSQTFLFEHTTNIRRKSIIEVLSKFKQQLT